MSSASHARGGLRRVLLRAAVGVVLVELTVRAALWVPGVLEPMVWANPSGTAAELMWTRNWLGWWAGGGEFTADLIEPATAHDPELGWVPLPGRNGAGPDGLRGPHPDRAADAVVVTLSGDSFAWGSDVEPEEAAAAVLEARRADVDVRNLGVYGYGHDQMWLRLRRRGPALEPDAAVLLAIGGDVWRNGWDWFAYARPRVVLEGTTPTAPTPVPAPWAVVARVTLRPRLLDLVHIWREQGRSTPEGPPRARVEELTGAILDAWVAEARELGATPIVLYLPSHHLVDPSRGVERVIDDDRAFYARWCADRPFPCRDGTDAFLAALDDPADGMGPAHWTAAGQRAAAGVLEDTLVDAGVLPPR